MRAATRSERRATRGTWRRPSEAALAWIAAAWLAGCAAEPAVRRAPVIYGSDDRVEILDDASATFRARATASVVAVLADPTRLSPCDATDVRWNAPTLGAFRSLCDSERFVEQPVIASCSGTLIDRDLVLTARHCLEGERACADARFVMGLHLDEAGALRRIPRADVYACQATYAAPGRDLLVVRLDRPVPPPFEPAPLGTAAVGMALHVAGFPTGLPMKSVDGCTVRSHVSGTDAYRIDCDLFAGSSGSGIFDDAGALLGVYTQGAGDYRPRGPGECSVALVLTQDGMLSSGVGTPQLGAFLPVAPAIEALCAAGHPSPLCGLAAACGDGVCSFGETTASCSDDCAPPTCGDEVCSPGEDFDCAVDCGARDRVAECSATTDAGAIPDAGAITTDAGDDAAPDAGAPAAAPSCAASRGHGRSAAWMALAMLALGTSSSLVRSRARSVASKRHSDARRSAPAPHPRVAR